MSQIEIMSSEEESQAISRASTQRRKPHAASKQSVLVEDRQKKHQAVSIPGPRKVNICVCVCVCVCVSRKQYNTDRSLVRERERGSEEGTLD